jgi:hypothetical protein
MNKANSHVIASPAVEHILIDLRQHRHPAQDLRGLGQVFDSRCS